MNTRRVGMALSILVVVVVLTAAPASATCPPYEGCTPGFWKRWLSRWPPTGVEPGTLLSDVGFNGQLALYGLDSDTFLTALGYHGGRGLVGAARNLMRAAAAAYLNAAHPDINYYSNDLDEVVQFVNGILASENRDVMLEAARQLDTLNKLGATF